MVADFKVCFEYDGWDQWLTTIWMREWSGGGPGEWRCVLSSTSPCLEKHFDPQVRLRQILRSLAVE
jgi:hypothetical protein